MQYVSKGKEKIPDTPCPVVVSVPEPNVHTFYEFGSGTRQFLVADPTSKHAIIVDAVMDGSTGSKISSSAADDILMIARQNGYTIDRVLETQAPGNQKSASWYLRTQLQQQTGVAPRVSSGKSFAGVQRMFARKYGIQDVGWSKSFDGEFQDGQVFEMGSLAVQVLRLPGKGPDHIGFLMGSNVFIGDPALTEIQDASKTDFESETAHQLWTSIQRLLSLPKDYRIYCSQVGERSLNSGKASATVDELRQRCGLLVGH
jgi:glyoxylase-like metal-dependent hydrolase (beta-lactamase superfamily II)